MKNRDEADGTRALQSRRRVAFIYYKKFSSFIKNDYEILSNYCSVEEVKLEGFKDIPRLAAAIMNCDISFTWFAGEHAFLAVIFSMCLGKRSILVAGGYDVAWEPEIGYGQFGMSWSNRMHSRVALSNADAVLAVSEFTKREVLKRAMPRKLRVIYNAIDIGKFFPRGNKEDLVLTVAHMSPHVVKLKGLDSFVKAAARLPKVKFEVIGPHLEDLMPDLSCDPPENICFPGYLPQEELVEHYQRAKVYCQLSYRESFGLSLAEAMACDCVPVVTGRGALPEVVGDTGFYVPYGDPIGAAEAIRAALESDLGEKARERIKAFFSMERREEALTTIMEELCNA